jgi:hypothetical protein
MTCMFLSQEALLEVLHRIKKGERLHPPTTDQHRFYLSSCLAIAMAQTMEGTSFPKAELVNPTTLASITLP